MFRSIALAALLGSLALPAAAASVRINVAGLDAETAHRRIVSAAQTACQAELNDQPSAVQYYQMGDCIADAVAEAEASYAKRSPGYAGVK